MKTTQPNTERKLVITGRDGWDVCEDCGSYDYEDYTFTLDGKVILEHKGDSHLGGGMWYSWEDVLKELLPELGIEVEFDI